MFGRINTMEDFIKAYEVCLKIKELKELDMLVEETDHYEGLLIDMLDFLGTLNLEDEKKLISKKPEYLAIALIRSELLKELDEYQDYCDDED